MARPTSAPSLKKKPISGKPARSKNVQTTSQPRLRPQNRRIKTKLDKQTKKINKLPNAWKLLGRSLKHIWRNKKLFGGIIFIYTLLHVLLVQGLSAHFQLGALKGNLQELYAGEMGSVEIGTTLFGALLGTAGGTSGETGSVYQTVLIVTVSLAVIWALRQSYSAQNKVRVRDSFYMGMTPLVPFILVLLVLILQMLPMLLGATLYGVVSSNGLAVGNIENALWITLTAGLVFASIYMISASVFALYIVTLKDMTPLRALRAARKLVKFRRLSILRKVIFLPILFLIIAAVILIPLIIFVTPAAEILFMLASMLALLMLHSYLYVMYREML